MPNNRLYIPHKHLIRPRQHQHFPNRQPLPPLPTSSQRRVIVIHRGIPHERIRPALQHRPVKQILVRVALHGRRGLVKGDPRRDKDDALEGGGKGDRGNGGVTVQEVGEEAQGEVAAC